ncbi:hypothetical protein GCM10009836_06950 [Pseudonocardia ailaonensis]|uniref:Glycosyltransferase RgtA/B/C/D-like domain-containing protein n=1 Tax=Pseudonocardia ailaonensis TaxID=367279 RepID=A0ABN2MMK5_9PSEU
MTAHDTRSNGPRDLSASDPEATQVMGRISAGTVADPPTTALPVVPTPPAQAPPEPGWFESRRPLLERWLSPVLAFLALTMLPLAVATTDLDALDGWGLVKVLGVPAWLALLFAIGACLTELHAKRPRIPMLGAATGVLILCSTGLPSVVEPAARFGTSWTISGFVDAVATANGVPPAGLDARFSWPAFFAQWAWFRDAAGADQLDVVLRWFPPAVVTVWAIGIYALARSMLGGNRAPWVAAWLFVGLNWIEQDYFSPQATGICLLLTVLTFALGPLATRRTDPNGVPGWPPPHVGAKRLPLWNRWLVSAMTPPNRPTLPPKQLLLVYFCAALCILAVIPEHQLTPFAILGQLALLAIVGRYRGRGLVLIGVLGVLVFILIAARDVWTTQISLFIGDGNTGAALESGVANRLAGDTGQIVGKYSRIGVAGISYALGVVGAFVYWRRRRDLVPIGLAAVPTAFAAQGYGGEGFLRIVLFGLPILTILGADFLRFLVRWRKWFRPVLAVAMVGLYVVLIFIRGGNDSYQTVFPRDLALYRLVVATTPPGQSVIPLSDAGPFAFEGLTLFGRGGGVQGCGQIAAQPDPVPCVAAINADVLVNYRSIEKQGEHLFLQKPGWSLQLANTLVAQGTYTMWYQDPTDPYDFVLRKTGAPVLSNAPAGRPG